MPAAALPGGAEDAGDGVAQAVVGIGDDELDALQAASHQALEEARPKRLSLAGPNAEADDFTPAVGRHRHGDYRRDRDDPSAIADLQVGRIEPKIRPVALERAIKDGVDAVVDFLAELGDLALGDARQAHRLHQLVDAPGGHTADPRLLDDRDQRLLCGPAWLQEGWKVRALAQLRDPELKVPEAGVERAVAIAIAGVEPVGRALMPACTDQAFDIGFH